MKLKNDKLFNSKIQKILNTLISEEIVATDFYSACTKATFKDQVDKFGKMFVDIANDEKLDHASALIKFAIDNDYDVPFKYKDYEKYANEKMFKLFNNLKSGEKTKYYIEQAIKSEELAIESYTEAMKIEDTPYELYQILMQNYYDEIEHLSKLNTLADALKAKVNLKYIPTTF